MMTFYRSKHEVGTWVTSDNLLMTAQVFGLNNV